MSGGRTNRLNRVSSDRYECLPKLSVRFFPFRELTPSTLALVYGWDGAFTQIGWFFTKAALLTFGGAYAVLPYVYQGAVEHYQWLSPVQMIDGLALGETTPGPLIMVVTFVGFVGGWTKEAFGPEAIFASAFVASAIATFFTFLPSFIFILLGGPFIETTHGNLKLTAPLTAITAAVVGVIVNLALFFAYHVFWPSGLRAFGPGSACGLASCSDCCYGPDCLISF